MEYIIQYQMFTTKFVIHKIQDYCPKIMLTSRTFRIYANKKIHWREKIYISKYYVVYV